MKWVLLCLFILTSCTTFGPKTEPVALLEITEMTPDKRSHLSTQNLVHLTKVYDLEPFYYSKTVQIKSGVRATHYPVIVLNTRFAEEPPKLLAAFLHEQFHWYLIKNSANAKAASARLLKMYPKLKDRTHIIVCYLEYLTMVKLQGKKVADQVIKDFIHKDKIFAWYYSEVLKNGYIFKKMFKQYKLIPAPLS